MKKLVEVGHPLNKPYGLVAGSYLRRRELTRGPPQLYGKRGRRPNTIDYRGS